MDNTIRCKVKYNNQLRRIAFPLCGFDELVERLKILWGFQSNADIVVKFIDDENEMITISSDEELKLALTISQHNLLRLFLEMRPTLHPNLVPPTTPQNPETNRKIEKTLKFRLSLDELKQFQEEKRLEVIRTKQQKSELEEQLSQDGNFLRFRVIGPENPEFSEKFKKPESKVNPVELRKTLAELETWEKKLERQESELLCATMREKLLRIRLRTTHQKKKIPLNWKKSRKFRRKILFSQRIRNKIPELGLGLC